MGHQQLLLIVLTTFVVVFAIAVGFKLFETSTVESNRDQVISDLVYLSSDAQAYYKKQVDMEVVVAVFKDGVYQIFIKDMKGEKYV